MHQMVDKLIKQYGTELTVNCQGEEKTVRGFFRAVNSKDTQSIQAATTTLGTVSRKKYTYIGPADLPVREGDTVTLAEDSYCFRRVEPYYYGNQLLYYWGLCIEKGGDEPWGQQV